MLGLSSDMFSGIIYQMFVITPAIGWIMQPGRFAPRQAIIYAIGFLALMGAITIGLHISEQQSNYFSVIGVPRQSATSEIKKAFRQRSIDLHPDKNPSPTAADEFSRLRLAFDVLGDADRRGLYDLYGEGAIEGNRDALMVSALIGALSFYGFWSVLTYVLTLGDNGRDARAWSYAGVVLFFILELNLQYAGAELPTKFFPFLTVFEFVGLLRAAFPLYFNGARSLAGYFYRDVATENFVLGVELLKSNRAILLSMRELQGEVASSRRRSDKPGKVATDAGDAVPAAARKRLKFNKEAANIPTSAFKQPAAKVEEDDSGEIPMPQPQVQAPPKFQIPGFVYFIGIYVAINYFLG